MKFVALVSGGKDSCFNILHCLANGHELVCLANLYPPPSSSSDEMDSFMYQTVGYQALQYYAECIGKPIYRQTISGTAANKKLEYAETAHDETEDLYQLLVKIIKAHPEVEAVSVGAILSNYQRTRVEDICNRLGLTCLSYLWERDQDELMQEMCESGLKAILIKVAAIGLKDKHLGLELPQAYPVLKQLHDRFGVNICGEGGEFETFVLDAPFFKNGELRIKDKKVIRHTNDEVWYLKLDMEVVKKNTSEIKDWSQYINVPPLLEPTFEELASSVNEIDLSKSLGQLVTKDSSDLADITWKQSVQQTDDVIYISNLSSPGKTVEDQVNGIFTNLKSILKKHGVTFQHIQSANLYVKDMGVFARVNTIYKSYFTKPLPPARCCVESCLPSSVYALLSVRVLLDLKYKHGLHVQSRSYWAPSNIGPYSQTVINEKSNSSMLSGQIPLIPKNMHLAAEPVGLSTCLALQHLTRVQRATGYTTSLLMTCFIKHSSWVGPVIKVHSFFATDKYRHNFVIAQITDLPMGAPVEWSAVGYKRPYDADYSDDKTKGICDSIRVTFASEASELKLSPSLHYTIYCKPENLKQLQLNGISYEYCPVVCVYSESGKSYTYAAVEE